MRDLMAAILVNDCRFYGGALLGFAVMPHHVHAVLRAPQGKTQSWFMQRIKSNSAKLVLPHLSPEVRQGIASVEGLNDRFFWMDGFRGLPLESEAIFWQKMNYTHENPVRAGLSASVGEYRWDSARWLQAGLMRHESGLEPQPILDFFGIPPDQLSVVAQLDKRRQDEDGAL